MTEASSRVPTRYRSLDHWVDEWLLPRCAHRLDDEARWCAMWWKHAEAVERLDVLWMAWEETRLQPRGEMSGWWIYHCRPHMMALTDPRGVFHRCRVNLETGTYEHFDPKPWPSVVGPAELFARIEDRPENT